MSTDLRALMRSLADEAPSLDDRHALADRAYRAGRHRRAVRHAVVSTASAIAVLLMLSTALFVGPTPLAAQYGRSSGTVVSGFPKEIGRQWPVLDLPSRPGPLAGIVTDLYQWWAVSPTGHRWHLGPIGSIQAADPTLSSDGRMLAYLASDQGPFVIRDLVRGTTTRVPDVGFNESRGDHARYSINLQSPSAFSADDSYLALPVAGASAIVDVRTGLVTRIVPLPGFIAGWSRHELVKLSAETPAVTFTDLDGRSRTLRLRARAALNWYGQYTGVVSDDGSRLAYLGGGSTNVQTLTQFSLTAGEQLGPTVVVPPFSTQCVASYGRQYVYSAAGDGPPHLTSVSEAGHVTASTRLSPTLQADCGIWAARAFDGAPRGRLLLDAVGDDVLRYRAWILAAVGWLIASVLVVLTDRSRGGRKRERLLLPTADRDDGGRRSRPGAAVWVVVLVPCLVVGIVGVVHALQPAAPVQLTVTRPMVLWSPADRARATDGALAGLPAKVLTQVLGPTGFALLVENPSAHPVTLAASRSDAGPGVAQSAAGDPHDPSLRWGESVQIPAHQSRWIRHVTNYTCLWKPGSQSSNSFTGISVTVSSGGASREEWLPVKPAYMVESVTKAPAGAPLCPETPSVTASAGPSASATPIP